MGDAIVADVKLTLERAARARSASPTATAGESLPEPTAGPSRTRSPAPRRCTRSRAAFPDDGIVVLEAPSSTLALRNQLRLSSPGSYYFGAGGGLGFGLSAAVGVQLAQPDRPVVCVVGEGSVQYAVTAFWSAVAYDVPVTFLVLRNSEYAILKWFAGDRGGRGRAGARPARRSTRAAIAAGYGVGTASVDDRRGAARGARGRDRRRAARSWSRSGSRRGCGSSRRQPRASSRSRRRPSPAERRRGARLGRRPGRPEPLRSRPDRAARRRPRARARQRHRPLRLRRQPLPAVPEGGRDGPRRRRRRARCSPTGAATGTPVTFRAGGTSLNGQGQTDGILVDVRRHFRGSRSSDGGARARVKPGTVLGHVNRVLAPHGRKLGPDPASTDIASVGGVIANNSGGMRCGVDPRLLLDGQRAHLRPALGDRDRQRRRRAPSERFAEAEPELAAGPARDPRRDPRRRRARRRGSGASSRSRTRPATGSAPSSTPRRRWRSSAACWSARRARSRSSPRRCSRPSPQPPRTTVSWLHFAEHRRGDRAGPRLRRGRRPRGRADGRAGADRRRLQHPRHARELAASSTRPRRRCWSSSAAPTRPSSTPPRRRAAEAARRPRADPRARLPPRRARRSRSTGRCARGCTA